ncbi:cyanophycin synthetase [Chryseobacterium sp.]|uniref:cyanophycin synthetase n=1 Tax=Chryseobacterium sp. TaxID=1871047 RepID=UPI0011CCC336|nr:cyanophycin synthetase [Chryseobacterium sp.]TXF79476.1 cyanophycin synthetase [Chryseobacterium sp.]
MIFDDIRIMRGPNMWSGKHQVLAVKYEPSLYPETGNAQYYGVTEYFRIHHGIEHSDTDVSRSLFRYTIRLAALLQDRNFHHEIIDLPGDRSYGIVEYGTEEGGTAALQTAGQIISALITGVEPASFLNACAYIASLNRKFGEGPSTSIITQAARRRNIPVSKGPAGYLILGQGKHQQRISAAMSPDTSSIAVNIACNKAATKEFLESQYLPVPPGAHTDQVSDLESIAENLGFPLVTKPLTGNQGRNVTCSISSIEELTEGFLYAQEISEKVIIEREIAGADYRLIIVGQQMIAASKRSPASVTGDGSSSVAELVHQENENELRGEGHENRLTKIHLDAATDAVLEKQGLSRISVPAEGQRVVLRQTANLSTGGTAEDVTDLVHPYNKMLAEKAAQIIGLDICGIDIIAPDISVPLSENEGAIIEVNAAPGLRMHQYPLTGTPRETGDPIVDLMFKKDQNGRIPIVAITGTNGKTTTTRLMAHVADSAGRTIGFSSTDGIYIGGHKIYGGDCSGPQSARTILQNPTIDFAVLESARGGIIRSGLGFDQCDIAIVTNVAADHLGLKDIHTVEDLAFVKSVVPRAVHQDGWAILNAGDELAYAMKNQLKCNVAVFSSDDRHENFVKHMEVGGTAVYTDPEQDIYISHRQEKIYICNAAEVPITRKGKAGFMIENLLPVVLASYLSGFPLEGTVAALKNFIPSGDTTPGRINELEINGVNVIVDYAHNPHGLKALAGYLKKIEGYKLGIITGTGDRREEDIIEFGRIAASMYDEIIIRFDRDLRGRTEDSIVELLTRGIHEVDPEKEYNIIPDTQTAIHHAVEHAPKGSYVVVCADNATYTLGLTRAVAEQFQNPA